MTKAELDQKFDNALSMMREWRLAVTQTLKEKGEQKLIIDEDYFEDSEWEDEEKGLVVECEDKHGCVCTAFLRSIKVDEYDTIKVYVTQWEFSEYNEWMYLSNFGSESDYILSCIDWKD